MIMTPLINARENVVDSDSTEDMLAAMEKANEVLETVKLNEGDLAVFSMDAEALFPSLALQDILQGIWNLVMESTVPFKSVNIQDMLKYLAVTYSEDELRKYNLIPVIPRRQTVLDGTSRGSPTIAFLETDTYT